MCVCVPASSTDMVKLYTVVWCFKLSVATLTPPTHHHPKKKKKPQNKLNPNSTLETEQLLCYKWIHQKYVYNWFFSP